MKLLTGLTGKGLAGKVLTGKVLAAKRRLAVAAAAIAVVTAALLVTGQGYPTSKVRMYTGTVWLASSQLGSATLVDGASAAVAAKVEVAAPGTPLSVTQQGGAAYVLERNTGALKRIDGATERVSPPVTLLPATQILAAPQALYAVDTQSGMVASADLDTLAPRDTPQPLAAGIGPDGPVVDSSGRLWAIDHRTGELIWLNGTQRQTRAAAAQSGASRLALTAGQPALVDPARGTAELLDPDTGTVARSARLDIQPGDTVAVSGSPDRQRLILAVGGRGVLTACAFDTDACTTPLTIASPGDDLGTPIEITDHAIVPNYSTGEATVVDLATMRVVAQRQLFDHPKRFELISREGFVFFNDPDSNQAGVLDLSGSVRTVSKYSQTAGNGDVAAPDPTTRQPNNEPTKTEPPVQAGIRETTTGSATPQPPGPSSPASATSIVVKPGNHGLVGDQFELTLVAQPPTGIADVRWDFGDGTAATGSTVQHRWERPGAFPVRATTTLTAGAQPTVAETLVTVDPPGAPPRIISLTIRKPAPVVEEPVFFSAEVAGSPDKWAWSVTQPGKPAPEAGAATPEFQHTFMTAGTYTVSLTVTAGGRTAHASQSLTVAPGAVTAWGSNGAGQLGVPLEATRGVIMVAGGSTHSLALKTDGSVVGWGDDLHGQSSIPALATTGVRAIAAGEEHSVALKTNGSVIAWGSDFNGQLSVPPQASTNVVGIAAGSYHSLAVKADGSVIGWGADWWGQTTIPPQAGSGVVAVSAGEGYSLALKNDGSVIAWGSNSFGQLNLPPEAGSGVVAIAAGKYFGLALKADGSVIGWGHNFDGQTTIPPQAQSGVAAIAAGNSHSLALKSDGSVIGWGANNVGQISIPSGAAGGVHAISAGSLHSLAC